MLRGHDREVTAVAWCPTDPHSIATCGDDATVKLWSVQRPWPPAPRCAPQVGPVPACSLLLFLFWDNMFHSLMGWTQALLFTAFRDWLGDSVCPLSRGFQMTDSCFHQDLVLRFCRCTFTRGPRAVDTHAYRFRILQFQMPLRILFFFTAAVIGKPI